jgi:hypothetical protein
MPIFAGDTRMTKDGRSQPKRAALRALALGGVVGLSLLAAACGGGSSNSKVAQISTTGSGNSSASSSASSKGDVRAYSACMRSHGVANFPDPDSKGRIAMNSGVDPESPQFKTAARACQTLLPTDGRPTPAQQAEDQQAMLKYARCMRAHGVPKFADPKAGEGLSIGKKAGVDPNTPQFKAAQQTCQKLLPGGPTSSGPAAPTP